MKTRFLQCLAASVCCATASAGVEDLWITEVIPSTGQIEVTNVGDASFTTTSALPFCHRFNYATSVPVGTTFAAGQSRIYTVTFSNQAASDLWIYSSRSFGSSVALLNGLKWGSTTAIGRTNVAVSGSDWDALDSFVPTPPSGQSLLLTGPDPRSADNWSVGEPDLGNFTRLEPLSIDIERGSEEIVISWSGGRPPYQLEESDDLNAWVPVGGLTTELQATLAIDSRPRRFFRVISEATASVSASFRVTFQSAWSGLTFATVPSVPSFGDVVGSTHDENGAFWQSGSPASPGLAALALGGSPGALEGEIDQAVAAGTAGQRINGAGIQQELGITSFEFTAQLDRPRLTLVSQLNDSPDWFTGLQDQNLLNEAGDWVDLLEIELQPHDAGVNSSFSYGLPALPTIPSGPISSLTGNPAFAPSFFLLQQGLLDPPPIGVITIERID